MAGLGPGRNFQQCPAIDGGDFDLGSQRGFGYADGDGEINIVAIAAEDGMLFGADDGVQIAGGSAVRAGVAFARQPNALAVASAGFDAYFQGLGFAEAAFSVTGGAGRNVFSGAVAARALHIELHTSAGLRDLAAASTLRTLSRSFLKALAVAGAADVETRNVQAHDAAPNGRPEGNLDLIFQIAARLRTGF